jgi:hypothetical protein
MATPRGPCNNQESSPALLPPPPSPPSSSHARDGAPRLAPAGKGTPSSPGIVFESGCRQVSWLPETWLILSLWRSWWLMGAAALAEVFEIFQPEKTIWGIATSAQNFPSESPLAGILGQSQGSAKERHGHIPGEAGCPCQNPRNTCVLTPAVASISLGL